MSEWQRRTDSEIPDAETAADMARPEVDYSAIDALAGHDERVARTLRANVAVIARRTEDRSLRELCLSILRGQQSIRRLLEHPSFHQMASTHIDNLQKGLDRLDDEERARVYAEMESGENILPEEAEFALMEGRPRPE